MEEGSLNNPNSHHQSQPGAGTEATSSYQTDLKHALTIQREHSGARQNIVELQSNAKWAAATRDTQATVVVKADEHVTRELANGG